eukprot:CAMPEP_0119571544 /NCGR_PEP_ID=MMETSP1352-20130426/44175_1 /TAXON_ID=265584 /ORGANISM="Stauroneis constricta, Strain CCMP1120" /LENGTH=574 /DNA_ID=CAMNT_0007621225 /DNA_START=16 /DNA_END=1740 /DNA_ORIENTATION=-
MAGAIFLFETMESTYCMPYMMREMKALTNEHPVAEGMILFSFATMVEGASGFGTPAALGTPMLVSMGHPALESVVMLLVFNTFATVWGAVGTPIWFGYGPLDLSEDDLLEIANRASIAMSISAFLLLPWALTILMPWRVVRRNLLFVMLAIAGTVGPSLGLSFFSYEFPSLLGGVIGCALTGLLSQFQVGLAQLSEEEEALWMEQRSKMLADSNAITAGKKHQAAPSDTSVQESGDIEQGSNDDGNDGGGDVKVVGSGSQSDGDNSEEQDAAVTNQSNDGKKVIDDANAEPAQDRNDQEAAIEEHLGPRKSFSLEYVVEVILRILPIWGVVLLLILTRVEEVGLKEHLVDKEPHFEIVLGSWGIFRLSRTLVFQLNHIMTYPNLNWTYQFLYIPFFMPFILISFVTFAIFRQGARLSPWQITKKTTGRLRNPAIALLGALVLVQLMIRSGTAAPAFIIGSNLADWFKEGFVIICPLIGALGSFFSGSTTVSNLTFGGIQLIAAESIGVSKTAMLALQAIGGSAGNGICLNNIIAACAVVGLKVSEGEILSRTARYVFSLTTIATVVMLVLFFRF